MNEIELKGQTMSEEKQIEEMVEELAKSFYEAITHLLALPTCRVLAADVIKLGYRKQSEGEWIKQTKKTTASVKGNEVEYHVNFCSECGYEIGSISYHHKFCQNCGARMKNAGWRDDVEAEMKGV